MYLPEWFRTGIAGAGIGLSGFLLSHPDEMRGQRGNVHRRRPKPRGASDFPYYPGQPQGYLQFSDRHAMAVETEKAMPQDPRERLRLIAFGHAFLQVIQARPFSGSLDWDQRQTLPCSGTPEDLKSVQWLLTMQSKGADTAGAFDRHAGRTDEGSGGRPG